MHTSGRRYNFSRFTMLEQFYYDILSGKITVKQAKDKQNEIKKEISSLDSYDKKRQDKIDERSNVLKNAKRNFVEREKIIEAFEEDIFLIPEEVLDKNQIGKQSEKERKNYFDRATKEVYRLETQFVNREIFSDYFGYKMPSEMLAKLIKSNKEDNIKLVASIEENLNKLGQDLKNASDSSLKSELEEIQHAVERIIELNKQDQQGQGLKILTSEQMLSRRPISLAQLKGGNNSQKLKNEIRQLLYSLYRSKKLSKQSIIVLSMLFKNGNNF